MSRPYFLLAFTCFVLVTSIAARAQGKYPGGLLSEPSAKYRAFTLTFNPFGLLETEPMAGLGVGYQWNRHWQIWVEGSAVVPGVYGPEYYYNFQLQKGFRAEVALKYYFGRNNNLFAGIEFRWKQVLFTGNEKLINRTSHDTSYNFKDRVWNRMPGIAIMVGGRSRPIWHHHFWVEWNLGLGFKFLHSQSTALPPGDVLDDGIIDHLDLVAIDPTQQNGMRVYIPAAVRLVYGF